MAVQATWVDGTKGDVTHYELHRKTGLGGSYTQIGVNIPNGTQIAVDSTAAVATLYYYKIIAVSPTGDEEVESNITTTSAVTVKKLVLLSTAGDRATIRIADRVVMLATNTWEILVDYKHDRATGLIRNWGFGSNISRVGFKGDGAYWIQINGLQTWPANQVEIGGVGRIVSDFNDGLRHEVRISRQASGELWLQIDDAIFQEADTSAALVTTDTTLWGFGINNQNNPEDNTLYRLRITQNSVVEADWNLTNGDGTAATVSNGKTIDITTTTGSLTAIWQNV